MSLFFKKMIDEDSYFAIWKITEKLDYFFNKLELSPEELLKINTYKNDRRKIEQLSTRALVKEILPKNCYIEYDKFGKPELKNPSRNVSISHSKDFVGIIYSKNSRVGIDIEFISNKIERIAEKFLSKKELQQIDNQNKIKNLYLYWCAKESLLKIYGKKDLSFINNLKINKINIETKGKFTAKIETSTFKHDYVLNYEFLNNYLIVWCLETNEV